MVAAGLDGIKKKLALPAPIEKDIFHMTPEERKKDGIDSLPGSLIEAIEVAEKVDIGVVEAFKLPIGGLSMGKCLDDKKVYVLEENNRRGGLFAAISEDIGCVINLSLIHI